MLSKSTHFYSSPAPQRPPCVKGAVMRQHDWGIVMCRYRTIPPSRLTPCHLPLHKGGFFVSSLDSLRSLGMTSGVTFCTAAGIPKGEAAETLVVDNLVRFLLGPSERSGKPTEVSRRLFAYFPAHEKVCPRPGCSRCLPRYGPWQ